MRRVDTLLDVRLRTSAAGRDLTMADYLDALDRLHAALLFAAVRPDIWPHTDNLPPEEEQRRQAARHFLAEAGIPVRDG